jgi:hypothetical protein
LPLGGSSTVHIYTQTIHRTAQNKQYIEQHKFFEECRPCSVFAGYTLAFALQLRIEHGKTSDRVVSVFSLVICVIIYSDKLTFEVHLSGFELVSDKNISLHLHLLSLELAVCEVNFVHSKLCMSNTIAELVSYLTVLSLVLRLSKLTIRILTSLIC